MRAYVKLQNRSRTLKHPRPKELNPVPHPVNREFVGRLAAKCRFDILN